MFILFTLWLSQVSALIYEARLLKRNLSKIKQTDVCWYRLLSNYLHQTISWIYVNNNLDF